MGEKWEKKKKTGIMRGWEEVQVPTGDPEFPDEKVPTPCLFFLKSISWFFFFFLGFARCGKRDERCRGRERGWGLRVLPGVMTERVSQPKRQKVCLSPVRVGD